MIDRSATHVMSALIADDEALARHRITELVAGRRDVRVIGHSASGPGTVDAVRGLKPDLLFLDVQMPGLNGFEVLAALQPDERPIVIFSTAYDEYALAAFEVHALDYLLKPFSDERFGHSIQRAIEARMGLHVSDLHQRIEQLLDRVGRDTGAELPDALTPGVYLERFAVGERERLTIVEAAAVDWIEAARDYVVLHSAGNTHVVRGTMAALEARLDPGRFLRIHRSTIVNLERVQHLHAAAHGTYVAVLRNGDRLRVGRRYTDAALLRLGLKW